MTMFICEALWVCLVYEKCYINQVALPCLLVLNTCCLPGVNVTPWKRGALLTYDFLLLELCQAFPTGEHMQLHLQIIVALYSIWVRRTLIALNNIFSTHCLLQTLIALSSIIRSTFWIHFKLSSLYYLLLFNLSCSAPEEIDTFSLRGLCFILCRDGGSLLNPCKARQ